MTTSYTTIPLRNHNHSGVSVGGQLDHATAHTTASLALDTVHVGSRSVCKAWCAILVAGTLEVPDHNVASVTDTGTGNRTVVWDTDFSTAIYSLEWAISLPGVVSGECAQHHFTSRAVGSVVVQHFGGATFDALIDAAFSIAAYGDQ